MPDVAALPRYRDEPHPLPHRVNVLGVHVCAVDTAAAVATVTDWLRRGERNYVCVTGVHGVTESLDDPVLRATHNRAGLTVPDGKPMVWAGRWAGLREIGHVRGSDLMLALLEQSARLGWRNFFYGGTPDIADLLAKRLQERIPGLISVGTYSPPYRQLTVEEDAAIVRAINSASPDLVWVGMSTPKQERWMAAHRELLTAGVLIGVGAAFDMHAGALRQAPKAMQDLGLEWLYRLAREPRRLWRRYLLGHTRFVGRVIVSPPRPVPWTGIAEVPTWATPDTIQDPDSAGAGGASPPPRSRPHAVSGQDFEGM
jgi:N-acetylglucosaminyldiphosphoundecaprenol N-acetyl-beta-D-mannosaminyltransferase